MIGYEDLFDISNQVQFIPKDSLLTIKRSNRIYSNSFEAIKDFKLQNKNLNQKVFLLEISNGYSVESYSFSIFKDKNGFYLNNKNRLKHFHYFENALKYELSSIYSKKYSLEKSIEYLCFEFNDIDKNTSFFDYRNLAYKYGNRIYI